MLMRTETRNSFSVKAVLYLDDRIINFSMKIAIFLLEEIHMKMFRKITFTLEIFQLFHKQLFADFVVEFICPDLKRKSFIELVHFVDGIILISSAFPDLSRSSL